MNYEDTLKWLFTQLPAFHKVGACAYKPGLERVRQLSSLFDNPHRRLKCIHVAGTNGKGSTAHTLAAVLQAQGYRVGLFTSPHLLDFRERIRVNGVMIPQAEVVDFVEKARGMAGDMEPSFFELTTVMAFDYFARCGVDYAVVEVGLGGRLDSTNIITPLLSVITNISLDHTSLLGNTEVEIAHEKAGIIKPGVPVVIGESAGDVRECFAAKARDCDSAVTYADDSDGIVEVISTGKVMTYVTRDFGTISGALTGNYQIANSRTILAAIGRLRDLGVAIGVDAVAKGFVQVCELTGLTGRWTTVSRNPLTICDTGHNSGGWRYISKQLGAIGKRKHIVIGFVNDKDVDAVLSMLTAVNDASYYFTQPDTPRRLSASVLAEKAARCGLTGECFGAVSDAYEKALADVVDKSREMIFIGGSNFVVADFLSAIS